jgi:hypothetical protein
MKKLLRVCAGISALPFATTNGFKCILISFALLMAATAGQSQGNRIAHQIAEHASVFEQMPAIEPLSYEEGATVQNKSLDQSVKEASFYRMNSAQIAQIMSEKPELLNISIRHEGTSWDLQLQVAHVMTETFEVFAASDRETPFAYVPGVYYWGVVSGKSQSLVALSFTQDEIMGFIQLGEQNFTLGKLENEDTHILYETDDLMKDQGISCFVDDTHQIGKGSIDTSPSRQLLTNCVKMYIEVDYDIYVQKGGSQQAADYVNGAFSQVAILYANENIEFVINELLVWNVPDPYTGPTTSNYLTQFRNRLNGNYNGDLAHLVGYNGGGGIAYVDVLCNGYYGVGYSAIQSSYNLVPAYSWTVEVLTHEIGHNLGSPHTHACAWNGNNTAIDGCGPAAGYSEGCNGPLPGSGTIMSYCHLVGGVGINFSNGFGPQPGSLIRNRITNAPCLESCGPPVLDDAGIIAITDPITFPCAASTTPMVTLQNFGANTLTSVTINSQLDNGSVQSYSWTGTLSQNQTMSVALPSISYGTGGHTFQASTSSPNGVADENTGNDSSSKSFTYYVDWCVCNSSTADITPNPLTHSGGGSSSAGVSLAVGSKHPDFVISNLGALENGRPQNRYTDVVTVTYVDGNGATQSYGTFNGSQQSTVNVSIFGFVNSISIALSNGQGNGNSVSVSFSVSLSSPTRSSIGSSSDSSSSVSAPTP